MGLLSFCRLIENSRIALIKVCYSQSLRGIINYLISAICVIERSELND